MSSFTDHLLLEDLGDGTFQLLKEFRYHVGDEDSNNVICVPRNFTTDFASVPRIFWNVIPPYGRHGKAAVVHDYLYATNGLHGRFNRQRCDEIFLEAITVLGVGAIKRQIMFRAVRMFGQKPWEACSK